MDRLFDIFESTEPLNPILTSFVTRTVGLLTARRSAEVKRWTPLSHGWWRCLKGLLSLQVLEYLSRKENFVDKALKHLNVTAVTDLFIRLITAHENDVFRYKMCEVSGTEDRFCQEHG